MTNIYKGSKEEKSANSIINSLDFVIEKSIKNLVNTAHLVRVEKVDTSNKKLDCALLVSQYDASGKLLEEARLYDIPYMTYQGGKVAIICDPCVNDIGLIVFAQQDISLVQSSKTVQPASFRSYDMADGLYIGGFLNENAEIFLHLSQEGSIEMNAKENIVLKAPNIAIEAENIEIKGQMVVEDNMQIKASLVVDEDVRVQSTSLVNHVHSGVQTGAGMTGKPI